MGCRKSPALEVGGDDLRGTEIRLRSLAQQQLGFVVGKIPIGKAPCGIRVERHGVHGRDSLCVIVTDEGKGVVGVLHRARRGNVRRSVEYGEERERAVVVDRTQFLG